MNDSEHKQALPSGFRLQSYHVVDVLGVGGFGVTYLGEHSTLGHRVAIKEYLPNEFAIRDGATVHPKSQSDREDFEWGLTRFLDEAKTLARFEHRNLVRVRDYFEANHTAYIVMDYEDGESLDRLLDRHGTLSESQLRRVLLPIIDGLRQVHAAGFLHRDIKPSNIYVRRADETPVLLDFGAARQALSRKSKSMTAVASAGYSPPEQYESDGDQGQWTDIYALSALCYRAITGQAPIEAPRRQSRLARGQLDPLPRLTETVLENYSKTFLQEVDLGLRVIETERPQTLDEWVSCFNFDSEPVGKNKAEIENVIQSQDKPARLTETIRDKAWAIGAVMAVVTIVALAVWTYIPGDVPAVDEVVKPQPEVIDTVTPVGDSPAPTKPEEPSLLGGGSSILVVTTEPTGAEVLVGEALIGETPLERTVILAGTHDVTLRHPDYKTLLLENQMFANGRVLRIEKMLIRGTGALTVVTEPRNTWIERNGERLASGTPVTLEGLPAGSLELLIGAEEHRPIQVRVDIPKDGVVQLERTLEWIPHGTLTMDVVPSDATVTLPNIASVYSPGVRVPEGQLQVVVRRPGYREVTRTIAVVGETRARIEMVRNPQPFTVVTTPAEAAISLLNSEDDYRNGILLEPGDYRIRVSALEYETVEETVSHGDAPTQYSVTLVRSPQPFNVEMAPYTATISFVDIEESYLPGMRLAPGEYRVRVSASGYEIFEGTVRHGTEPTRYRVELVSFQQSFTDKLVSGGNGPEMMVIPAGRFLMGCVSGMNCGFNEKPIHEVSIGQSFALSKFEVTFAQWDVCVVDGGCNGYRPDDLGWERSSRPVIQVSWEDAQTYVSWLSRSTGENYRLPSESEWEYAARAGSTAQYNWGNDIGRNRANCDGCGSKWNQRTAPVGSFAANAFGLQDMHGNVYEWVQDCWNDSYTGAPTDGRAWVHGDCEIRIVRGGSWDSGPRALRSADRSRVTTGVRGYFLGFRVTRTLTP